MKNSLVFFKFKRIRISIHWTFLAVIVWLFASNIILGFELTHFFYSFLFIFLIFFSVAIHELGHFLIASYYKIQINEIALLPTGGISLDENYPQNIKQEIIISITGPLINLIIAVLLIPFIQNHTSIWYIGKNFSIIGKDDFLYKIHLINLFIFCTNLLPAFPMDGGRIFRTLLSKRMDYFKATQIVIITGITISFGILIWGITHFNLFFLLISLLIMGAVKSEGYKIYLNSLTKGILFNEVAMQGYPTLQAHSTVKESMNALLNNYAKYFFVIDEGKPIGIIRRIRIVTEIAEMNYDAPIKSVMKEIVEIFNASDSIEKEFKKLYAFPDQYYPVMQGELFIGVVNLLGVIEYLILHQLSPKEHKRLKALLDKL